MGALAESFMLICFGISWPVSVYKSYKSRTAAGKSLVFMVAIVLGYLSGIAGKLLTGAITYVLALYIINVCMVLADILLYFRNKRMDKWGDSNAEQRKYANDYAVQGAKSAGSRG